MEYSEFEAGLAKRPELLGEIMEKHNETFVKDLTDNRKMIVTTQDAYAKDREEAIGQGTKTAHTEWEAKFEKVTGMKKPDGIKGLAWFDQIADKIKFLTDDGTDPNSAIIKGLQKELSDLKTNLTKKEQEALQARIEGQVTSAIKGLAFAVPSHLKKDDEKSAFQRQKSEDAADIFNARYTTSVDAQGRFVFTNKKGEAQTENGEPMTAEAIATRDFANDLVPKGHKGSGAGSSNDDVPNPNGNPDFLGNTTDEIRLKLSHMGVGTGTEKWADLYSKAHLAAGYEKKDGQFIKKV